MAAYQHTFPREQGLLFQDILQQLNLFVQTPTLKENPDRITLQVVSSKSNLEAAWEIFKSEWNRLIQPQEPPLDHNPCKE